MGMWVKIKDVQFSLHFMLFGVIHRKERFPFSMSFFELFLKQMFLTYKNIENYYGT